MSSVVVFVFVMATANGDTQDKTTDKKDTNCGQTSDKWLHGLEGQLILEII
jgi:hypothetical protein